MTPQRTPHAPRRRGRPSKSDGGPLISRESIVEKALEIAGVEGFGALTMHHLADELGVTPRALYNHVSDRQDVIDEVARLMMQRLPESTLDAGDWRESLRAAYREAREAYRGFPRATLISLDERITDVSIDPNRIRLSERHLRFFVEIGLDLPQAVVMRGAFLADIFAFALLVDYRYDRVDEPMRATMSQPVPAPWLEVHPELDAPLSQEAAALPALTSDEMFEATVDLRIAAIERIIET